ncbi:Crp/Fnr family transcriptional regulator [Hydrogenophaga sp.]|uniref:Crp/Fnr family transcriptional regulator n=1 Tax=Hydrogenophaga sp. TaxID=1904254 RepID=UPI002FC61BD6
MTTLDNLDQNNLLASLPENERKLWGRCMELVNLPIGMVLHESGEPLRSAYFPTTAIVSLTHELREGGPTQFATVGREGVVGTSIFLGSDFSPCCAVVLVAGKGYCLPAAILKKGFDHSSAVMHMMLRYTQALLVQVSRTAVCNRHHLLDQRLCCWLLLYLDRTPGEELVMTQEMLSHILGVRRSGITMAAIELQSTGLISYTRGRIAVLDRPGLERRSCECYRMMKDDNERLLPAL